MRIVIKDTTRSRRQVYFWITHPLREMPDSSDFVVVGLCDTSREANDIIDRLNIEEEEGVLLTTNKR